MKEARSHVRNIVTLTTDFGYRDAYVGSMKGVVLSIAPHATLVDITHDIPPYQIVFAALVLREACPRFPGQSIHVAVVDPGVGGPRRPLLLELGGHFYVGPDNGLFTLLLRDYPLEGAWELANRSYFLPEVSATFHGRDVFAPVAAWVAQGVSPEEFGPSVSSPFTLEIPGVVCTQDLLEGEIICVDRFGNCISNIASRVFAEWIQADPFRIEIRGHTLTEIARSYDAVPPGRPLAIFGGLGYLEIALNQSRASESLGVQPGDAIVVERRVRHP